MVNADFSAVQVGLINYLAPIFVLIKEILSYLVNENGGLFWAADGSGQIYMTGQLPTITNKGTDIIGALMTIIHNGIVAVAEFTTLLPANALAPVGAG